MFSFWKTLLPILGKGNKKDRLLCLKKYNNLIVFYVYLVVCVEKCSFVMILYVRKCRIFLLSCV